MAKNPSYLLIVLIVLVVILIYLMDFAVIESMQVKAKKALVLHSIKCEGKRKSWLAQVANYSIKELEYLNLQLSYMDSEGNTSACTAGWEGLPYVSHKVTQDTLLNFASVTKVFTSELILDLVRQQKISLNDKLVNFLPKINTDNLNDARVADITISDLLSHRAGFDGNITNDTMVSTLPWCPYDIKQLQGITLDFDPNSKNVYSNIGYCLLAKVIENVYAKSYTEVSLDYFNFDNSGIRFIQSNRADQRKIPDMNKSAYLINLDFYALASVGALTGNSNELVRYIHEMDRVSYPNVTSRSNGINCEVTYVRGCHGFSGYEYSADKKLTLYWRDGRLPKASALVTIDSDGGVLAFLSSSEDSAAWLTTHNQLIKKIYNIYLEEKNHV
ncbi:serine hydrolase domain-containing protein [Psychrobacter sp. ANT_H3]|uniref:serine hydrolase domain-containing protein n=1 Tax=Psychrobacter sp. ANT_H3 TaxID=3019444 RepID=UPI0022F18B3F|nr:serine hydrolase domain-containing protein [Psychrobacter sp. ANT_H3]MDA5133807.1 serine hydrolase [Psychrobacter sp. ANT_H3]